MNHPSSRAQFLLAYDCPHELVRVEAALHQRLHLVISCKPYRSSGCGVAVLCRQKLVRGKIDTGLVGCGSYPRLGSDQHGNDEVRLGGFDRAEQRVGIDRVNHGRTNGLQPPRLPDQLLVMMTAIATIRLSYASR